MACRSKVTLSVRGECSVGIDIGGTIVADRQQRTPVEFASQFIAEDVRTRRFS